MKNRIKRLFCLHEYEQETAWEYAVTFRTAYFRCKKCGQFKRVEV